MNALKLDINRLTGVLVLDSCEVRHLTIDVVRQLASSHQVQVTEVEAEGFKKFSLPVQFADEDCRLRLDFEIATGRLDDFYLYWMGGIARRKQWDATLGDLKQDLRALSALVSAHQGIALTPALEWVEEASFHWGSIRLEASPKAMTIAVTFNLIAPTPAS